jgi:Fe2+ transport system protein B
MLAVALDPKPEKKPPPAKATRLYTPVVAPPVDTRPQSLPNPEPIQSKVASFSLPASPDSKEAKHASDVRGNVSVPSMEDASAYLDKVQSSAMQAHGWLTQVFTHPVVFVLVYLFFMLLTYYLPYAGSNSAVAAAVHAAASSVNKPFWAHLFSLGMLVGATWYRGSVIGKSWIMIFPIIAAVFDLAPLLNWIPLIPTAMHLAALIMGVRGRST